MTNLLSRLFLPAPGGRFALSRWASWTSTSEDEDFGTLAGVHLTRESALAVAAIYACVRVISYVVSTLPIDTMRREGGVRVPVLRPEWVDAPDPANPNLTRIVHFGQVVSSMMLEGQSFVQVVPSVFEPVQLGVLDPRRIEIKKGPLYRIHLRSGGFREYGPDEILHVPHPLFLGDNQRAVSPIEALRQGMALSLAADRYGANFYEQGTVMSGVIRVKGKLPLNEQEEIRDAWTKRYGGVKNAHKPGVLTDDADWKPLGVTPEQAQFIEQRRYQAEEMARAYGVPPSIIGITTPGAVSYASVEQQNRAFVDFTLRPIVESIEAAYQRLIPGRETFLKFNMRALLRGDSAARAEYYAKLGGIGALLTDEIRALEDEPPIPGGRVPRVQLNTSSPTAADAQVQANAFKSLVEAGYPIALAARVTGLPEPGGAP